MEIKQYIESTDAPFDPETYWRDREFKIWVVTLYHPVRRGQRRRRGHDHTLKYVRARTEKAAIRTARANHFTKERISGASARLATPTDLGAIPTGSSLDF